MLFSFSASGQSISGSTTPVLGQVYAYSFSAFCQSTAWFVSPNGTVISQSASVVVVRWNSPGTSYVRASGGASVCSGGSWASLDFTMPNTLTIMGFVATNQGTVIQHHTGVDLYNANNTRIDSKTPEEYIGRYIFTVPYSFSGKIKMFDTDYSWSPTERTFSNIITNQFAQNFTGTPNCVGEYIRMSINNNGWHWTGNLINGHQYVITLTYQDNTVDPNPITVTGQDVCYEQGYGNGSKAIKSACIKNLTTNYQSCN